MRYHPTWHEYNAALHLLTTPLIAERTAPYVRPDRFDWDGLFDELAPVLSSGEHILVSAAFDLWGGERDGGYRPVTLREVALRLDDKYTCRVLEAIAMLCGCYAFLDESIRPRGRVGAAIEVPELAS